MSKMHVIMMQQGVLLHKVSENLFAFIFKLRLYKSHEVLLKLRAFAYSFLNAIQILLMRLRVTILSIFILTFAILSPLNLLFFVFSKLLLLKVFFCLLMQFFYFKFTQTFEHLNSKLFQLITRLLLKKIILLDFPLLSEIIRIHILVTYFILRHQLLKKFRVRSVYLHLIL
jgi:hypothetical protein